MIVKGLLKWNENGIGISLEVLHQGQSCAITACQDMTLVYPVLHIIKFIQMQEFGRAEMAGTLPHQGAEGPVDCIAVERDRRWPLWAERLLAWSCRGSRMQLGSADGCRNPIAQDGRDASTPGIRRPVGDCTRCGRVGIVPRIGPD
jgi:hypothetical protein